jgi:hypothetical protein
VWSGRPAGGRSIVGNPLIVNDPAPGAVVNVEDYGKLYALAPPPVLAVAGRVQGSVAASGAEARH